MALSYAPGLLSTRSHDAAAEQALRQPSSTLWLAAVALPVRDLEAALAFYVTVVGFRLRTVEAHPLRQGLLRAVLLDAEGRDVLELVEARPGEGGGFTQLAFHLPRRAWTLLRVRLGVRGIPFAEAGGQLWIEDPDGVALRFEPLDS